MAYGVDSIQKAVKNQKVKAPLKIFKRGFFILKYGKRF